MQCSVHGNLVSPLSLHSQRRQFTAAPFCHCTTGRLFLCSRPPCPPSSPTILQPFLLDFVCSLRCAGIPQRASKFRHGRRWASAPSSPPFLPRRHRPLLLSYPRCRAPCAAVIPQRACRTTRHHPARGAACLLAFHSCGPIHPHSALIPRPPCHVYTQCRSPLACHSFAASAVRCLLRAHALCLRARPLSTCQTAHSSASPPKKCEVQI
mmetsp:Transcript_24145/g.75483  ORF Transcript_24145/g.75483 Transcript_24145/m.75483 type:complete len:209 (+) Transcript_24145:1394-2020(+)